MVALRQRMRAAMNSRTLFIACAGLSAGGLGLALALNRDWMAALLALAVGVVWALPSALLETTSKGPVTSLPSAVTATTSKRAVTSLPAAARYVTPPVRKLLEGLDGDWLANIWFGLLAIGGVWVNLGGQSWWLAVGIAATALAAWDLHAFRRRVFAAHGAGELTRLRAYHPAGAAHTQAGSHSRDSLDARRVGEASSAYAESAAFERAHLRALGRVWLVGILGTALAYGLASRLRFSAELGLALGVSLAFVVGMILLARLLTRR